MEAISEAEIRGSFVNCSKGEASRIKLPADFTETAWRDLDFYGWIDPGAPQWAAVAVPACDGLRTLLLRRAEGGGRGARPGRACARSA